MYKNILHPTDLNENHFYMCEKAADLAKRYKAKLYLLHVIEPPSSLQLAQGLGFAEFAKPATENAKAVMNVLADTLGLKEDQIFVEIGSVKMHIFDKVITIPCDLVIVGKHSPGKLPALLGSIAHTTVHHAPCDVLTLQATP